MTGTKRGLGRGLGALIPSEPAGAGESQRITAGRRANTSGEVPGEVQGEISRDGSLEGQATYAELEIGLIGPNPRQPRTVFDEDAMAELVASIKAVGLLQPVVVRTAAGGRFELIAGERRWRACQLAGMTRIPAIIRQTEDDALLRDALLENLHRADLNPLEEAAAYAQLLQEFGCTQEELASRIGRSRPQVTNTLRLLRLPPDVQRRVAAGVLSAGHARALLALDDPAAMEQLAQRIVAEGLSVRSVEEIVLVGAAEPGAGRERGRSSERDPKVSELVEDLAARAADRLDTRASAEGFRSAKSKGRLVIECADAEDLRRIVDLLGG